MSSFAGNGNNDKINSSTGRIFLFTLPFDLLTFKRLVNIYRVGIKNLPNTWVQPVYVSASRKSFWAKRQASWKRWAHKVTNCLQQIWSSRIFGLKAQLVVLRSCQTLWHLLRKQIAKSEEFPLLFPASNTLSIEITKTKIIYQDCTRF